MRYWNPLLSWHRWVVFAIAWAIPVAGFADCSSSQGCADCPDEFNPKCVFVTTDASCTCDLFLFGGKLACGVNGECDYTSGGSGGDGSAGGDTGTTCYRLPGQWCPPSCSSCETIFWV